VPDDGRMLSTALFVNEAGLTLRAIRRVSRRVDSSSSIYVRRLKQMERKNPLSPIRAFRRAFGDRTDVLLVVKTAKGELRCRRPPAVRDGAGGGQCADHRHGDPEGGDRRADRGV
jgi:hypothetical protein